MGDDSGGSGVILVVDDDREIRELYAEVLDRAGFTVRQASSGAQALRLVEGVELVILDVVLPDLDGYEICRRLRETPELESLPVLMISGLHTDSDHRSAGIEIGANIYLTKPVTIRELLAGVHALIRLRRAETARRLSEAQYRALVDNIPDIVWTCDATGRFLYVSPNVERTLGYTADALRAAGPLRWLARVERGDVRRVVLAHQALFARGERLDVEFRFRHRDGRWIWLHNRAVRAVDERGLLVAEGLVSDVTDRKRAAEAVAARVRQSALGADIGAALTADRPLRVVLRDCADAIVRHLDVALTGIWAPRVDEGVLELQASAGDLDRREGSPPAAHPGSAAVAHIARTRRAVVTNDLRHDPLAAEDHAWATREGIVGFAGYPLVVGGRVVGVVAMFSRRPIPGVITATVAAMMDTIALGIDHRHAADALRAAQEDLWMGVLGNTLDLGQVLGRLVDITRSIIGGDLVEIWLVSESGDLLRQFQAGDGQAAPGAPAVAPGEGVKKAILRHKLPVVLSDAVAASPVADREWLQAEGIVSLLGVPLVIEGEAIGVLLCMTRARRAWTEDDRSRAQVLATHAAVALRNARLFQESEGRRQAAEALGAVSRLVSQSLDPNEVEARVVESVSRLLAADGAALYRVDPATDELVLHRDFGPSGVWFKTVRPGVATVGLAAVEHRAIATVDSLIDPRIRLDEETRALVEASPYRPILAAPLVGQSGVIGVLVVGDREGRVFTPEEIGLAQAFADQAAIAVQNARLYEQVNAQVHELERLANAVIESARAKEEFLVSVSHELGTPLTAIKAYVDTMTGDPKLDLQIRREFLGVLQKEVDRLARLIGNILDASRLEMGRLEYWMVSLDLAALVEDVVANARARRPVTLRAGETLPVKGDRDRLTQVLLNLLDNAIKFSPPDTPVVVVAGVEQEQAVVRVFDRGPGVPEEAEAQLFERFARGGRPSGTLPSGSGLGLYLSNEIVKAHGGAIAFERHPDWSGVFAVRLPLRRDLAL